ncbi:MAG TPA: SDR family oxidoreductase [Verrucomicrobiae bacterium]|nr:SDR family oxidoreductase [Verrucomicrobiae bacterium]
MAPALNPPALDGKGLVVIGGTGGIGLSAVKAFVAAGASVVAVGLEEDLATAARELGPAARFIHSDATRPETAPNAIEECASLFGRFDGLYHVAGGSGRRWGDGPLHEITNDGWRLTMELNLTSVFYSNRAAVRQLLSRNSGGTILNLTSVLAFSPSGDHFATHSYAAAKSGIIGLTKSCASLYAPKRIRFNALAPGLVQTPMAQRAANDPKIMAFVKSKQPLDGGRIGHPSDLDAAAVFFMSDASRFSTGQVLTVDGGWSVTDGQTTP